MGNGFIVIGTVEETPKSAALEARAQDFYKGAKRGAELLFLAIHYETFREPTIDLHIGRNQIPVMERLRSYGTIFCGTTEYRRGAFFDNPLTAVIPTRRKSLWGMKDYFGRIAQVPTVAVIPAPLLDIPDYEAVISGMLPELLERQGQSQLTTFYDQAVRQECAAFLSDFKNIQKNPNTGGLRNILDAQRKRLKTYLPSDHSLNEELDYAIQVHDFKAAEALIIREFGSQKKKRKRR